jgi:nucleotide-binding universal stress UspA family protein
MGSRQGVTMMGGPGVVAGFDGSAASVRALDWAAAEATMRQVPLTVCHVREDPTTMRSDGTGPRSWAADRTLSRGVTLGRQQDRVLDVVPRLLGGSAAAALLELSDGAQMLVAGTRGTGNWSWPGLGSVSNQLAARASCPLLLVPDDGIWRDGPVVVGVDGTPSSQRAAGFAFGEAHLRHVPVLAVCWSQEPGQAEGSAGPWRRKYPDVDFSVSSALKAPAAALRALADTAPLLVVGSRGAGDIPGLLLGKVAHELLQNAEHPIVVVR